jgi:hypothetical protein
MPSLSDQTFVPGRQNAPHGFDALPIAGLAHPQTD